MRIMSRGSNGRSSPKPLKRQVQAWTQLEHSILHWSRKRVAINPSRVVLAVYMAVDRRRCTEGTRCALTISLSAKAITQSGEQAARLMARKVDDERPSGCSGQAQSCGAKVVGHRLGLPDLPWHDWDEWGKGLAWPPLL